MSDNHYPVSDGVGRLSVLTQDALDDSSTGSNIETNFGFRKSRNLAVTFEDAHNESGTGVYQLKLLVVCGLVNMSCAISNTTVSFVLPSAKDFNLNSTTIGILNGAPFLGMVLGAYFWGMCGDIKGRRFVILWSMGLDTLFSVLSCLTQHVVLFFITRLGNGFAIIGAICLIYVYFGEFLTPDKRDAYLLFLEIFWVAGMIVGPGVAMVVIPSNIVLLSHSYFTFDAWRLFLLLTSIPSLISFILIYQYPESPRYLMLKGHMVQSREILEQIYFTNNKKTTELYSVESFTQSFSAIGFNTTSIGNSFSKNLKVRLIALKNKHKILFFEYSRNITVTCIIEFCLMASYITVLIWIPELFSRYYNYKLHNSNDTNICTASECLLKNNYKPKDEVVSSDAYFAALIVATSTVPFVILTGILIKYLNKKILLCASCGVPIIIALLITLTKNNFQAEIMCCIFEGFTTLMEPIIFCTMVELFPSNVRGVAFSMTVMIGRLGAVFGIIVFGTLIDEHCFMVFYILAILLLIAFLAMAFLPKLKVGGSH
ncbi:Major facilitator superfamily,Major facilitator superfamily domain,Major facilitator, sugar transporter- [Cinara cedri]|uniref:Major facilitator superfamily,Major facilitator superfamily domain,Major facilitator, sugar transporter n=1 Tax=Cinara cedri TaxID=506608 RepID=A0A5E4M7C0_9HEMI|nr:Major facilitator superfamily,Major facilitator superfamily domain,Major facilitator, sugar transporter- [Cinara cedri]